jgi:hypothetical protein
MSHHDKAAQIDTPTDDPKPPEQPDEPDPPTTPGGGSVRPGGSPGDTPGVDSPLKD